jgi:hypothetical protein
MKHLDTSCVRHVHIKRWTRWKAQSPLEALGGLGWSSLPMSAIIFVDAWLASFLNKGRVYVLWIACSLLQAFFSFSVYLRNKSKELSLSQAAMSVQQNSTWPNSRTRDVSNCGLAIYIKKYLNAKKNQVYLLKTMAKILQDIITL